MIFTTNFPLLLTVVRNHHKFPPDAVKFSTSFKSVIVVMLKGYPNATKATLFGVRTRMTTKDTSYCKVPEL